MNHRQCLLSRIAAASLLVTLGAAAQAATPVLFNTGVDGSGHTLATGAVDTRFTITGGGFVDAPAYAVDDAEGFPGYWLAPSASSKWLTPLLSGGFAGSVAAVDFAFSTQFDLSGYNPATASISGLVTADNGIAQILINGQSIGFSSYGYGSFLPFSISSGFVAGVNRIDFVAYNGGGPMGLRAELAGEFTPAVPEPAIAWTLLAGIAALVARSRRVSATGGPAVPR